MAHKKFGELPWKRLFEPAIELAEMGFPLDSYCAQLFDDLNSFDFFDEQLRSKPTLTAFFALATISIPSMRAKTPSKLQKNVFYN